jgi:hypothetical protein
MKEDFKNFLADKDISVEKYAGMTDELQFKWSELFEKNKPQGKLSIQSLILCESTIFLSFWLISCCYFILMRFSFVSSTVSRFLFLLTFLF